ncbi:MAG: SPOR domain-containing protein [Pseudomonadota bacterium]
MDRVLLKRLLGAGVIVALAVIVLPFALQGEGYKAALRTDIPARPQPPQPLDTASVEPPAEVRELMEAPPPLPVPAATRTEPSRDLADVGAAKAQPGSPILQPSMAEAPLRGERPSTQPPKSPEPEVKAAPKTQPPSPKPAMDAPRPAAPAASLAGVAASMPQAPLGSGPREPDGVGDAAARPGSAVATKPMAVGQWMIQLGSFSSESNAQHLRGQVQRAGIPCLIEPLDIEGRKVWRVRAGPFASQAEADAALKRLQGGLRLGGMVMQVR